MYIQKGQERMLKQLSRSRGVSKAEIIRQEIQRETAGEKQYLPASDPDAWQEILRFLEVEKLTVLGVALPLGTPGCL
jgi:hypothetical protein